MGERGGYADRYSSIAIALHWMIAILILANLSVGFFMEGFAPALRRIVIPLHASSGITVLVLTIVRVLWRLTHRPPPLLEGLKTWEERLAHAVHGLLYGLMILMPLTGWSILSAHPSRPGQGLAIWGLVRLPPIAPISSMEPSAQRAAHGYFVEGHAVAACLLLGLLALHVGGALKHQFYDRRPELARMGIGSGAG